MNVALYLRMSSDAQELSLAQQEAELRRLCDRKAYRIAAVYRDEGISGDNFERRRGFRKLLDDAGTGTFCRVLAWDQDRIGRHDSLTSGAVLAPLRKHGVVIETITQGELDLESFAGRVTFTVQQEAKHQFLRDLSRNVSRGQIAKAEAADGYFGGPRVYGYTRDTKLVGRRRVSRLVVNESQAAIVRRIFTEYQKPDASFGTIADGLNADKVPTPNGAAHWENTTIRQIARHPVYTGRMVYGRKPSGKYSRRTDEGLVSLRPGQAVKKAKPIVRLAPDIVPPIIDDATFERVQKLADERRLATRPRGTIHRLSGLLVCRQCGRRFHGEAGAYKCSSSNLSKKPGRCSGHRIKEAPILSLIEEMIQRHLGTPSATARLRQAIEKRIATDKAKATDELPQLRKHLASLERQLRDGAAKLLAVPPGLVPELAKALDVVREERDALASHLDQLSKKPAAKPTPKAVVDEIAGLARDLKKAIAKADPALVNHCLKRIGTEITIHSNTREKVEAEVRLFAIGDSVASAGCCHRLSASHFLAEKAMLPPPKRPGFAKGNKCQAKGNTPEKARAASLAGWRKRREADSMAAMKAAAKAKRSPVPAATR